MTEKIARIIEDTIWEEHDNCEIKKGTYKECPAKCCYIRAAEAIEAEFQKRVTKYSQRRKIYNGNNGEAGKC